MSRIVYKSNGGTVGDGTRITRVSGGGTKFEVMVDEKTERFSEVIVAADDTQPGGGDDTQTGGGDDTQPGGGDDTQPGGGGTIPTPPVIGQTVAVDESDLMAKANALKWTGKDYTIGVKDGHFGAVAFSGLELGGGARLTIVAENRRRAIFERITLTGGSKNIRTVGIGVCPRGVPTLAPKGKTYGFTADPSCPGIEVIDGIFRGSLDSGNHPWWDLATWQAQALGAVFLQGAGSLIENCYAEAVNFGFNLTGAGSTMRRLYVYGASGDAFRAAADNLTAEDLLGTDLVYKRDDNHPDLFQGFVNIGGNQVRGVHNLKVRRLAGIEWTQNYRNPLRVAVDAQNDAMRTPGIMQGFGFHAVGHQDLDLEDIWIRTAVSNGIHIGGVTNLRGRRWTVLNGDYEVRSDRYAGVGQPGANYDTRFPKIAVNASGAVDVDDTLAEDYSGTLAPMITNRKDVTSTDYAAPAPAWVDAIRLAAA